ncbi:hypothetical protein GE061_002398 [Apolygus lucorum]|uniref:Uncharacterized protein n=1 Tax=Apolygus lucorum TaxID=248454 RepID=A0A8S9X6R3_APOLU|nr:hypothetical protein GE061_002398 [Apolygus lucorum]
MASPQQVGNTVEVATSAEEQRGRTLETIAIIGGTADLFEEMPEQLAIITGCMAQLAEGLRTNISRMDQTNRALTRDVATLRYQTRARQDHSETDSDHGEPCEPDTSRRSDMQVRPVTTTPEPPESAHRIGDEPVDRDERYPERAVPPYPPLSPAPPLTLRGSVPGLKLCILPISKYKNYLVTQVFSNMSLASKITLTLCCATSVGIIGYVHFKQQEDREKLKGGVLRDIEQQQMKKAQNLYTLELQKNLENKYKEAEALEKIANLNKYSN